MKVCTETPCAVLWSFMHVMSITGLKQKAVILQPIVLMITLCVHVLSMNMLI